MKATIAARWLALAAARLLLAPATGLVSPAEAPRCVAKHGKGWAWTEDMAKFQGWEIVAQVAGNWPIQSNTFRNERRKKDGSGSTCLSWIDVCKS